MPKLLKTPFAIDAAEGFRTDIQESTGAAPNSATYQVGFPPVTMQSIASNGMPPKGSDLNGVLYDITDNLVFLTQGGGYGFDSAYATAIGGYPLNARLRLTNGDIVKSTINGNTNDPNVDMTGWELQPKASDVIQSKLVTDSYVTPQMFAPQGVDIGDGVVDFHPYLELALATGKKVLLPPPTVKYRCTKQIELHASNIVGVGSALEYFTTSTKPKVIIEFDEVEGDAVVNNSNLSYVENAWFRQKNWTTELNGLFLNRYAYFKDCLFTNFNGYGFYSWTDGINNTNLSAYHSVFDRCQFLQNKKHGVALFNGANAVTLRDCMSRWNGSPSYGVQPTTAGEWDGLYVDGKNSEYPPSYPLEPQGVLVEGGDYSYNSRYGQNWHSCGQNVLIGGYIEHNKVSDLRLGAIFGMQVINPMLNAVIPVLDVIQQDPEVSSRNLDNYPNQIVVNGTNYGTGLKNADASTQRGANTIQNFPAFRTRTSVTSLNIYAKNNGDFMFDSVTRGNSVNFGDNVPLKSNNTRFGAYAKSTVANDANVRSYFSSATGADGEIIASFVTAGAWGQIRSVSGSGSGSGECFFAMPKSTTTNRSINAAGTINASGADYAEYMYKSDGCGGIQKGEIVGVNSEGKLTKQYDESISFVVKSTEPSIVGGDAWFNEQLADDASDEDKAAFAERLEDARQQVDRIAFCGQVPIIYHAEPGDYIIPVRKSDGSIDIEATKKPSFEQHVKCVGKVWRVISNISYIVVFNN